MQIIWHGQFCFQIIAHRERNNQVNIVIDPFDETTGLRVPKLEADVLLLSRSHHGEDNTKAVSGTLHSTGGVDTPFLINGPGEYEVKEVFVHGIPSFHNNVLSEEKSQNTIYTIEVEGIQLCHLGAFSQKELTPDQLEKIGEVDILMIPIGGFPHQNQRQETISSKEAPKIMSQIEPKIIIPMYYQIPKLKIKLDGLDKFLKTMGIKSIEPLPKLLVKKKDLPEEEVKIIVLK